MANLDPAVEQQLADMPDDDFAALMARVRPPDEPRKPGSVPNEGRTVTTGSGEPAQVFAEFFRNARGR